LEAQLQWVVGGDRFRSPPRPPGAAAFEDPAAPSWPPCHRVRRLGADPGARRSLLEPVELAEIGLAWIEHRDDLRRDRAEAPRFDEAAPVGIVVDLDREGAHSDLPGVGLGKLV